MNWIGIDPGKSGGIAVIYKKPKNNCYQQFLCFSSGTERDIWDFVKDHIVNYTPKLRFKACIERVHSSPQMGVTSSFSFGQSYGFLRGILIASEIPFAEVTPVTWQKTLKCLSKGDKNITKSRAQQLFPKLKITHGNADALLIAEYCRVSEQQ